MQQELHISSIYISGRKAKVSRVRGRDIYDHFKIICIYTKNSVFNLVKHAIFDFLVTQTNRGRVSEGEKIINSWIKKLNYTNGRSAQL